MLAGHPQSAQASTERSRPRSRLLMMKERLRLQRQRGQQQTTGNCQHDDAEQTLTSTTSESYPVAASAQTPPPPAVQAPVKGRRFQRSRHAEQQARSRSQDAVTTTVNNDGFLGCTGGTRPLQKSKSVDMDLEKITQESSGTNRRSNTVSVEVRKLVASSSQRVEKKGSFLSRSSSLLARLSGKSGQKKFQSPSPLRHESNSASVENPDDSIGTSADRSGTSSTLSKTASLSEARHREVPMSSDSTKVEGADSQRLPISVASGCRPTVVQSQSDQTRDSVTLGDLRLINDRRVCRCSASVKNSHILLSRADSKCHEKAAALEQGSEIVLAAEMRRGLPRQTSEDPISHTRTENCCSRRQPLHGEIETVKNLSAVGHPVSLSAGNLPHVREDFASNDVGMNGMAVTSAVSSVAATCDPAALDAVTMTAYEQQHSEYKLLLYVLSRRICKACNVGHWPAESV